MREKRPMCSEGRVINVGKRRGVFRFISTAYINVQLLAAKQIKRQHHQRSSPCLVASGLSELMGFSSRVGRDLQPRRIEYLPLLPDYSLEAQAEKATIGDHEGTLSCSTAVVRKAQSNKQIKQKALKSGLPTPTHLVFHRY